MSRGLGRKFKPDSRDEQYRIRRSSFLRADEPPRTRRYWYRHKTWYDQGDTSSCVGHAWAHWLLAGPITHDRRYALPGPFDIYRRALQLDPFPGEADEGTTIRAGAQALAEVGLIKQYLWAWDLDTLIFTVRDVAPVVAGINWYSKMDRPNLFGRVTVDGWIRGGHAIKIDGVNTKKELFRFQNSWGRSWGLFGAAYISFADMDRLIREDGEVCLAIEQRVA